MQRTLTRKLLDSAQREADGGSSGILALQGAGRCVPLRDHGSPSFVVAVAPTDDALHALHGLLQTINTWPVKSLTRPGVLVDGIGQTKLAKPDADGKEARAEATADGGGHASHRLRPPRWAAGGDSARREATRCPGAPAPLRRNRRFRRVRPCWPAANPSFGDDYPWPGLPVRLHARKLTLAGRWFVGCHGSARRHGRPAFDQRQDGQAQAQISVCSDISKASSTSMPR